jgi:hypothetical protein
MTKLDWEKDQQKRRPKEPPTDQLNDDPKKGPSLRKVKPVILDEIARQTRWLATSWQAMGPATLEKAADALRSLVHMYVANPNQLTVEILNAREVLGRIAGSRAKDTVPKSYRIIRSPSARRSGRKATLKRAGRRC